MDLCKLAGLEPVSVICEMMHSDGTMCRFDACSEIAKRHSLPVITVDQIIQYRKLSGDVPLLPRIPFLDSIVDMALLSIGEFASMDGYSEGHNPLSAWVMFCSALVIMLLLFMNMQLAESGLLHCFLHSWLVLLYASLPGSW